jgi:hypothetical protein
MPAALPPEKNPVPFEQEAEWVPELLWTFWNGKKSLAPTKIQTLDSLAHSTVTIPTLPSQPLTLQVIYRYIQNVSAEMDCVSFKIICQFYFG